MKIKFNLLLFFFLILSVLGCDIRKNKMERLDEFSKVYDSDSSGVSYHILDIKESLAGNFISLGYTNTGNTFILITDKEGKFIWSKNFTEYINPLSHILQSGANLYIVALTENYNQGTFLLQINEDSKNLDIVKSFQSGLRPLDASITNDGGLLILNFDAVNNKTVLLKFDSNYQPDLNFDKDGKKEYTVQITDVLLDKMNNHIFHLEDPLPFFAGN